MKITIATLGSRGDVQPFLALAVALSRAGHAVRLATNEPFRALVIEHGVEFASLGGDIKEIVGDRGRAALLAADGHPVASFRALREFVGPLVREGLCRLDEALAGSDVVLGQMLAPGAAHFAERHDLPYFEASYDPTVPTRAFPHPGAPPVRPGVLSWLTHAAAEQIFWQAFRRDVNAFRRDALGLAAAPFLGPAARSVRRRPPALLGYSAALVPRPRDWPDHVTVTGSWFLEPPASFSPPARLVDFLSAGAPPVYVGFGSMTLERPEAMTRGILEGIRRAGRRAVISTGWGALAEADGAGDVIFVGDVPHAWLFPRMAAVVHHGGAGTTAEALRAGVPQLVVPFLADQPFWGRRVMLAGAGPSPVPIRALTAASLATAIDRMTDPSMRHRAAALGEIARAEPGARGAVEAVHRHLERRASQRSQTMLPDTAAQQRCASRVGGNAITGGCTVSGITAGRDRGRPRRTGGSSNMRRSSAPDATCAGVATICWTVTARPRHYGCVARSGGEGEAAVGQAPHGITLFDHAQIAAEIAEGDRPFTAVLEARGLTETQWNESTVHWMTRMGDDAREHGENARVAVVYSDAFGAAQNALKPVPPIDAASWAKLTVDIQIAGGPAQPLAARGLSQADYLRLARHWARVLSTDAAENAAFFEAYQAAQPSDAPPAPAE